METWLNNHAEGILTVVGSVLVALITYFRFKAKQKVDLEQVSTVFASKLLADQTAFRQELMKELNDTKDQLEAYRKENQGLKTELDGIKANLEKLTNTKNALEQENSELKAQVKLLESQKFQLEMERDSNLEQMRKLEIHVKELEAELSEQPKDEI